MQPHRRMALVAGVAILALLGYWGAIAADFGGVMLVPMGDHDGGLCGSSSIPSEGPPPEAPCGLSVTPLFAATLFVMAVGAILALLGRTRAAAGICALALAMVAVETWLGRATASGTLSWRRALIHIIVLALATTLLRAPRTRGLMPAASPSHDP